MIEHQLDPLPVGISDALGVHVLHILLGSSCSFLYCIVGAVANGKGHDNHMENKHHTG